MPKTPREMHEAVIANLEPKTGRDLAGWLALLREQGPTGKARVAWLKAEHGLGHGQATTIVREADGGPDFMKGPDALLAAQYADDKAALRPIYEAVVAAATGFGDDVRVEPCSGYVSLLRKRQFAMIKASTNSRVDVGLALSDAPLQGRLAPAKSLGGSDRITHRLPLAGVDEVDAEAVAALRAAYDRDV